MNKVNVIKTVLNKLAEKGIERLPIKTVRSHLLEEVKFIADGNAGQCRPNEYPGKHIAWRWNQ